MEYHVRSFIAIILVGLFFVLALIFGAKNEQLVTVSYFIAEGEYRLPLVLAVVFFGGFMLSWLFAFFYIAKLKLALRKAHKLLSKKGISIKPAQDKTV
ncbi:lipopolysaccharide assembly protein LapA domain-containing protein [Shewanella sp. SR44-3]|uniref:LapA family protein n=1 Tax=unclassified Shewanella TaxID=196818 RepID=UPI001C71F8D5